MAGTWSLKRRLLGHLTSRIDRRVDALIAARMLKMLPAAEPQPTQPTASLPLGRASEAGPPNLNELAIALRELDNMRWDIKVLGSALAERCYAAGHLSGPIPAAPTTVPLASKLCCQADLEQPWFRYWANQLRMVPLYHRKVWEDTYVLQALWEAGMLGAGRQGLGFAVGNEALPAYLAGRGVEVLASDLSTSDQRSIAWQGTGQHATNLAQLFRAELVTRERFDALCRYRPLDMNAIPAELYGNFDFCWSVCSFEHLGSIEQGLDFVVNSLRCLRPGGVAVHTTEFNLDNGGETIDNWGTVLFQRRHIDDLGRRLAANGHELVAVDYNVGSGPLDGFVDLPPYPHAFPSAMPGGDAPHLRLSVDGFPVTSIGLVVRGAR